MSGLAVVRHTARGAVKSLLEETLIRSGLPAVLRARRRGDALVLAFHNIVPHGETAAGDLSLHLAQQAFGQLLDSVLETHEIVPLHGTLAAPEKRRRPRLAITFDDAYVGAVTAGVEEVVRRGLHATIFVPPAFVGGETFWWDEVADVASGAVPAAVREHCLWSLHGDTLSVRRWAAESRIRRNVLPEHQRCASETQLRRAVSRPGITVANHTWSHVNLAAVDAGRLEEELNRPVEWLHERFQRVLPWITYPYGLYSAQVERAAERSGQIAGMRVDGGWLRPEGRERDRYRLPRLNVPAGVTVNGFRLRAAGVRQ